MTTTSLDAIVENLLNKRRYSIHWYMEFMLYVKEAVLELGYDGEISTFRYCVLPVNDNHAITLPNDYSDWIRVSAFIDGYIHPLVPDNSLNLVPNYDSDFNIQPYSAGIASVSSSTQQPYYFNGMTAPYWWLNNWNIFGENLGRLYGGGVSSDTFRENRLRNEIKINELFLADYILLEYSGNGLSADNATQIDVEAAATIRAYAMWQFKENNRTYNINEAGISEQAYIGERQKLRARKSDLTIDFLRRTVQKNSVGIKM